MDKSLRVFVSSTKRDLEAERDAVMRALEKKRDEFVAVAMEHWISSDEEPKEASLRRLQKSDIYIGIIGFFYCAKLDPETGKSVTQLEYEFAKEHNIPRLIFLKDEDTSVKPMFVEQDPQKILLLNAFKEQVKTERLVNTFKNADDLATLVVIALDKYVKQREQSTSEFIPIINTGLFQRRNTIVGQYDYKMPQVGFELSNLTDSPIRAYVKATVFLGEEKLEVTGDKHGYYSGEMPWDQTARYAFFGNFGIPEKCVSSRETLRVQMDLTIIDPQRREHKLLRLYTYHREKNVWFPETTSFENLRKRAQEKGYKL